MTPNLESQVYLKFFKNSLPILLIGLLIGGLIGYKLSLSQPTQYISEILMQMDYTEDNLTQRSLLTDQAVSTLRTRSIQHTLDLHSKLTVHKNGPVNITVSAQSTDSRQSQEDLDKLRVFAESKYPLSQFGDIVQTVKTVDKLVYIATLATIGLLLGLGVSLVRSYLQNY